MKHTLKVYYSVVNCAYGSAYPRFALTEELANIHQELQNLNKDLGESHTGSILLESDSPITLIDEYQITKESLLDEIEYSELKDCLNIKERINKL